MANRLAFQDRLEEILGSANVYFQPPSGFRMSYPCFEYSLNRLDVKRANNGVYLMTNGYTVTLIYKDPDSELRNKVLMSFDHCSFNTHFTSDNLHHDVFEIYY